MKPEFRIDRALTLVVLAGLIVGCYLVLQPFLTAIVWAAILCAHGALGHLAGERGHRLAGVATLTVRGVVVGILGGEAT